MGDSSGVKAARENLREIYGRRDYAIIGELVEPRTPSPVRVL